MFIKIQKKRVEVVFDGKSDPCRLRGEKLLHTWRWGCSGMWVWSEPTLPACTRSWGDPGLQLRVQAGPRASWECGLLPSRATPTKDEAGPCVPQRPQPASGDREQSTSTTLWNAATQRQASHGALLGPCSDGLSTPSLLSPQRTGDPMD